MIEAWLSFIDEMDSVWAGNKLIPHWCLSENQGINLRKVFLKHLGRPRADTLRNSKMSNLKELHMTYKGDPYRILYAFDPEREALLLIGGNKANDKKWYEKMISQAEEIFATHLERLKEKQNHDNN